MKTGNEHDDTERVAPYPIADNEPNEPSTFDADGHGSFRNMCLVYGDFHRPVFLRAITNWFVRSANKTELSALRRAISSRSGSMAARGKRGRPRGPDDPEWLAKVKVAAWNRIVDGRTWWEVAEQEGLKPTRTNIRTIERTLTRRQDQYATIIWRACSMAGVWKVGGDLGTNLAYLEKALDTTRLRQWLWSQAHLPFKDLPDGCKKIVLALVPRGRIAAGRQVEQMVRYQRQTRRG